MAKYLKMPVEVDAIQFKEGETTWKDIEQFLGGDPGDRFVCDDMDWIVKDRSRYWVYNEDEFNESFKEVSRGQ